VITTGSVRAASAWWLKERTNSALEIRFMKASKECPLGKTIGRVVRKAGILTLITPRRQNKTRRV
jgi:hypothetical protein